MIFQGPTVSAGAQRNVGARAFGDGTWVRVQRLLTPEAGLLGQGVRFVLGGCTSAAVYLLSTTVLALVVGLPFEVALAIGFCLLVAVNFTLHRTFVWVHREGFALPAHRQFGRYMSFVGTQYALTAASIAVLPRALGLSAELVYILTALALATVSFATFRRGVFHASEDVASAG
jgi:putative flippase GtrA